MCSSTKGYVVSLNVRGKYRGTEVAIKKLKSNEVNINLENFIEEAKTMRFGISNLVMTI